MEFVDLRKRSGWNRVIGMIELLQAMNGATQDFAGVFNEAVAQYGTPTDFYFGPANEVSPCFFYAAFGRKGLLVCHWTDDQRQGTPEATQYLPGPQELALLDSASRQYPRGLYNEAAGKRVADAIRARNPLALESLLIVGHSFGHAVGCHAFLNLADAVSYAPCSTQIFSFGGNGWANEISKSGIESAASIVRIQNEDDPVPCAPWIFGESATVLLSASNPLISRLRNFHHVGVGYNFSATGQLRYGTYPNLQDSRHYVQLASIGDWFYSFVGDTVTPHQTGVYKQRLQLYIATLPEEVPGPPPSAGVEEAAPWLPSGENIGRWLAEKVSQLVGDVKAAAGHSAVVVSTDQNGVPIGGGVSTYLPTRLYVVRRVSPGLYAVALDGEVISLYNSKRQAKKESSRLNRARRRVVPVS